MKKALLLSISLAFFIGCSTDSDTNSEIESVDLTKIINPDTATAAAELDNSSNGIYKGVTNTNSSGQAIYTFGSLTPGTNIPVMCKVENQTSMYYVAGVNKTKTKTVLKTFALKKQIA